MLRVLFLLLIFNPNIVFANEKSFAEIINDTFDCEFGARTQQAFENIQGLQTALHDFQNHKDTKECEAFRVQAYDIPNMGSISTLLQLTQEERELEMMVRKIKSESSLVSQLSRQITDIEAEIAHTTDTNESNRLSDLLSRYRNKKNSLEVQVLGYRERLFDLQLAVEEARSRAGLDRDQTGLVELNKLVNFITEIPDNVPPMCDSARKVVEKAGLSVLGVASFFMDDPASVSTGLLVKGLQSFLKFNDGMNRKKERSLQFQLDLSKTALSLACAGNSLSQKMCQAKQDVQSGVALYRDHCDMNVSEIDNLLGLSEILRIDNENEDRLKAEHPIDFYYGAQKKIENLIKLLDSKSIENAIIDDNALEEHRKALINDAERILEKSKSLEGSWNSNNVVLAQTPGTSNPTYSEEVVVEPSRYSMDDFKCEYINLVSRYKKVRDIGLKSSDTIQSVANYADLVSLSGAQSVCDVGEQMKDIDDSTILRGDTFDTFTKWMSDNNSSANGLLTKAIDKAASDFREGLKQEKKSAGNNFDKYQVMAGDSFTASKGRNLGRLCFSFLATPKLASTNVKDKCDEVEYVTPNGEIYKFSDYSNLTDTQRACKWRDIEIGILPPNRSIQVR